MEINQAHLPEPQRSRRDWQLPAVIRSFSSAPSGIPKRAVARPAGARGIALPLAAALAALLLSLPGVAQAPAQTPLTLPAAVHDTSPPLGQMTAHAPPPPPPLTPAQLAARRAAYFAAHPQARRVSGSPPEPVAPPPIAPAAAAIEQTREGEWPAAALVADFAGLGFGFHGPQGAADPRNPSDNSLAAGPRYLIQTVNSRLAIFDKSGRALDGPIPTNVLFSGFQGDCGKTPFGDVVVRYDQLARRWVFVLPIFRRPRGAAPDAPYAVCYAVSAGQNPLGRYYRYQFTRKLFPDYPRLGIWPDGYYLGTSTGDTVIQKHACVAERAAMLRGFPAREQCAVLDGVNFLNPADLEGRRKPPQGAPELFFAAGGAQLRKVFADDALVMFRFHVNWRDPRQSRVTGPFRIPVAPYHYLCNGQLSNCVPQPGTQRRLDAQGDKLMQAVVYRRVGRRELVAALHSIDTAAGGGGVRWYELQLDRPQLPVLLQQGTYAPGGGYRWMGSLGLDRRGDLAIGYSYGDAAHFAGQRMSARLAHDARGKLTFAETVLARGAAAQTYSLRWEDYATLAVDPSDDCTFWYAGDFYEKDAKSYSTRIGALRLPGCR